MAAEQSFPGNGSLALIATSVMMRSVLSRVDTIAGSDTSVLLIGEPGVGKELAAEYIHRISPRSTAPLSKSDSPHSRRSSWKANSSAMNEEHTPARPE